MESSGKAENAAKLAEQLGLLLGGECPVDRLSRLSGGANRETWSFELVRGERKRPLILRRSFDSDTSREQIAGLALDTEARLVASLGEARLPVPEVVYILRPGDELGAGYVMSKLAGETLAPRILRRDQYAQARSRLARECGHALAAIHGAPIAQSGELPEMQAGNVLAHYRDRYESYERPRPVLELAFRWLEDRKPPPVQSVLVHGDFRNGNLVVDERGLRGVLDWELAHRGDPMEDLGWITVNSWRFGMSHRPVGGFGSRRELLLGYREAGGDPDEERMRYWQLMGSLKWGVMCMTMTDIYRRGIDRSIERAAIGRRVSEAEIDILNFIRGRDT